MKFEKKNLGKAYIFDQEYLDNLLYNNVDVKKNYTINEIREYLKYSDRFVVNSLIKMYTLQTSDEQVNKATTHHNGVGFNAFDANILSDIAKQCIERKFITCKQINLVYTKIRKYAGQITKIANGDLNISKGEDEMCKYLGFDSCCNGYCNNEENKEHYRKIVYDDNNSICRNCPFREEEV